VAAQDLIISRRGQSAPASFYDPDSPEASGPDGATILLGVLRKRWLLLLCVAAVSAVLAVICVMQLGRTSATITSSLIFTGLPDTSHQSSFDPLGPATGAEMIKSAQVLEQVVSKKGLGITAASLENAIASDIGRSSALLNLTLNWEDAAEGIDILNTLTETFIKKMADQRQEIQKKHLQYLENSELQARNKVVDLRERLAGLRKQQQQQLDKGGQSADKYRTQLALIDNTTISIQTATAEQATVAEQIKEIEKRIAERTAKQQELEKNLQNAFLSETSTVLKAARETARPGSSSARRIGETIAKITTFNNTEKLSDDVSRWVKSLLKILEDPSSGIAEAELNSLKESFELISRKGETDLNQNLVERRRFEAQLDDLKLKTIHIASQVAMLTKRKADYEKAAEKLKEEITGVSATQLDEVDAELSKAEKVNDAVTIERESLDQLVKSQLMEWTVSVPASMETTKIGSNSAKLFVVVFALCGLVLSAPLLVAEWRAQTGTPQVQFARSLRVPVLAERVLEDFSPQQRGRKVEERLTAEQTEALRMLTLRIQQSCHRSGSVVLFSSLDSRFSAAPLMATVAECLAEREERVLLVDAVSPNRALTPVVNVLPGSNGAPAGANGKPKQPNIPAVAHSEKDAKSAVGLSEYLAEECEDVSDLIRPTSCPGVDLIASGRNEFPREAMASSCLTELLNTCRRNYTMVLVHGPAVDCPADLQMLTARADGVVLAATQSIGSDNRARNFVQELLDLGAPIIGIAT
jgi:Mrp family chromosome partitioning ATPase/capsular polysaccharide biosynthesis protein